MKFGFISLFPELIEQGMRSGVVGQAVNKGLLSYHITNPRDFTEDVHKTVDDRPYGGGDGMLMMAEPLKRSLDRDLSRFSADEKPLVIYTSPQGKKLDQALVRRLAEEKSILLICGRYAGIDQRIINHYVDEEISIGDYVLSGGELPALVIADAVARQLPGVLGNPSSPTQDSFAGEEGLLEAPQFTRPAEFLGQKVPAFLLSGNHTKIAEYRWALSVVLTARKRRDLPVDPEQLRQAQALLKELPAEDLKNCGLQDGSVF